MSVAFAEIKHHLSNRNDLLCYDENPFTGTINTKNNECFFESQYLNGLRHGIQKTFYTSGQLKEASMFTSGNRNGRSIRYFECGAKQSNANYYNGDLDGVYEEWLESGRLTVRKSYFKGKLVAVTASKY